MWNIILITLTIIIAVIVAFLGVTLPFDRIHTVFIISRFFDAMIPILAVGALLKYLTVPRFRDSDRLDQPVRRTYPDEQPTRKI